MPKRAEFNGNDVPGIIGPDFFGIGAEQSGKLRPVVAKDPDRPPELRQKFVVEKTHRGTPDKPAHQEENPHVPGITPDGEHTKAKTSPQKKRAVPGQNQIARANILAKNWDKPLSELTSSTGELLPGLSEDTMPDDR